METNTAKYRFLNNQWCCAVCNVKLKKEALKKHYYEMHGEYKDKHSCNHCNRLVEKDTFDQHQKTEHCQEVKRRLQGNDPQEPHWTREAQYMKVDGGAALQCYLCDMAFSSPGLPLTKFSFNSIFVIKSID